MLHIQDFASLVSVLCGLNITLGFWDGLTERLSAYKKRLMKFEEWSDDIIEDILNTGKHPDAYELVRRARKQLDWVFLGEIEKKITILQIFSFGMAAVGIAVLAFTGLCRLHNICILPLGLWTQYPVVIGYISLSALPYIIIGWRVRVNVRDKVNLMIWNIKKDVQQTLESLEK